jgi:integral membrane sensor domain MASE1
MRAARTALHLLLFLVAALVFFLGLGIGLSQNPTVGTLLWLVAAGIVVANAIWMTRRRPRP